MTWVLSAYMLTAETVSFQLQAGDGSERSGQSVDHNGSTSRHDFRDLAGVSFVIADQGTVPQ